MPQIEPANIYTASFVLEKKKIKLVVKKRIIILQTPKTVLVPLDNRSHNEHAGMYIAPNLKKIARIDTKGKIKKKL